jgi:hypothetical protein
MTGMFSRLQHGSKCGIYKVFCQYIKKIYTALAKRRKFATCSPLVFPARFAGF